MNIYKVNLVTFYFQCEYERNKPNQNSCGYSFRKDKKELHGLNGNVSQQRKLKIQGNVNQILYKRCQNQDNLKVSNSNPVEIQNTTIIYKNNIQSDDLVNKNNVIQQNSSISNKGSFEEKGSIDAFK